LRWNKKSDWEDVLAECAKEKVPLPKIGWKNSADCHQGFENSKIFNTMKYWERGCKKGGRWTLVLQD